jgi:hypothetical protein
MTDCDRGSSADCISLRYAQSNPSRRILSNPYEPPKAPLKTSQTRRSFRWRIVPCSVLAIFGAYTALAPLITVVVEVAKSPHMTNRLGFARTLGMLTLSAAGVLWIFSGAMFWKRSWWIAVVLLVVGYAIGVFAGWQIWGLAI